MLLRWFLSLSLLAWAGPLDQHIENLRSPDPVVRQSAARAIGELGEWGAPAVPALVGSASRPPLAGQIEAIRALGKIGPAAHHAVDFLFHLGSNLKVDEELAREGYAALAKMGPGIGPDLLPFLTSRRRFERMTAAETLVRLGAESEAVLETLIPLLRHRDRFLALDAAEILGRMGTRALPALPALLQTVRRLDRYEIRPLGELADPWTAAEHREFLVGVAEALRLIAPEDADVRAALRRLERKFRDAGMAGAAEEVARRRQSAEAERQLNYLLLTLHDPADWQLTRVEPLAELLERLEAPNRMLYLANIADEAQAPDAFLAALVQSFARRENAVVLDQLRQIPRCTRYFLPGPGW